MGIERKKGGRGLSASFWHTGFMELLFEFKEIKYKCFKILGKKYLDEDNSIHYHREKLHYGFLIFCPRQK
jgi:hypothetical protein